MLFLHLTRYDSTMSAFVEISGKLFFNIGKERWEKLKSFEIRPDDVFITGYPRSGTTWTQQIVKLLRNNGKDDGVRLDLTIPFMEFIGSPPANHMEYEVDLESLPSPRAFKSNLPYEFAPGGLPHTTPAKYIYIARNPKDAAVSMWHHQSNMAHHPARPWDEFYKSYFGDEPMPYGNIFDHILGFWANKDSPFSSSYVRKRMLGESLFAQKPRMWSKMFPYGMGSSPK